MNYFLGQRFATYYSIQRNNPKTSEIELKRTSVKTKRDKQQLTESKSKQ